MINSLEKICKLDSEDILTLFREKLMRLKMETEMIDVKLDEEEMKELGSVLRNILSIGSKRVKNVNEDLIQMEVKTAEPPVVKAYFDHKFKLGKSMQEILRETRPYLRGNYSFEIPDFFEEGVKNKILAKVLPTLKQISIVKISDNGVYTRENIDLSSKIITYQKSASVTDAKGKVYILGGWDQKLKQPTGNLYIYDHTSHTVKQVHGLQIPRASHSMCVDSFDIYVNGGRDENLEMVNSMEKYDILTSRWEMLPGCSSNSLKSLLLPFKN